MTTFIIISDTMIIFIKIIIVHSIFLLLFNRGSGGDQARIGGRAWIVESSASRSSGGNFHDCDDDDDDDGDNDDDDVQGGLWL